MTPEEQNVIRRCRAVLLDFDGPMCSAFAGYPAPQVAKDMLTRSREAGVPISEKASTETDPMEVLRYLFKVAPERHFESERMLREAEIISTSKASPTYGAVEFMETCKDTKRPLVVVSNNSPEAVMIFLKEYDLTDLVNEVFGRSRLSPKLMKPHPHLIDLAINHLNENPADCIMVGDSTTDIEVAQKANIPTVGFANKPEKLTEFRIMKSDVIIDSMKDLSTCMKEVH